MKKMIGIVVAVAVAIVIAVVIFINIKPEKQENPRIAYILGDLYYVTDNKCEMVPRKMADGVIETFVQPDIMPDMFDSANFGSEYGSMEYMFLDDGRLIIKMGNNWYYCDKQ